ncbi:hypothetical protein QYM36_008357, partial [Artemia franciscana]
EKPLLFEERWPIMQPTVSKLVRQDCVSRAEWQDLFGEVHRVCLWDERSPDKMYKALQEEIMTFIREAQIRVLQHQDEQALLNAYISEWTRFWTQCSYLPMPFVQLEACLLGKTTSNPQRKQPVQESMVKKLMLDSWNKSIFSSIKQKLQDAAMHLVYKERCNEQFDSNLVIGVRESYVNLCSNACDQLQIYRDHFEKAYIDFTRSFYLQQAGSYLAENGMQEYMKYADAKLKEEEQRASKYLEPGPESQIKLQNCCVDVLVTAFKETLLSECPSLISTNETERLRLLFSLVDRVPGGTEPLLTYLEDHIFQSGLSDMMENASTINQDSEKYVEQLLSLFRRFSKLVKDAFNGDPRFLTARDKAFKKVVNDTSVFSLDLPSRQGAATRVPESRCPELLANYCDMLLRKTQLSKRLTPDEVDARLKDVLLVLKYVQNRDVFMRYHKTHLTRRLILETSADSDKEEMMVEWLREVGMPADFVHKLARMFQDIKVSSDLNREFKEEFKRSREVATDVINIKILNWGAWGRSGDRVPVSLPLELEEIVPEVEDFYKRHHSGRKLQWHHHMSNGTIHFSNETGEYDLDVTTFQMAVLFAWNERPKDKISFESLRLATEIPDVELRRTIWSLVAFPKLKRQVLSYYPECQSPKDFANSTVFWVNQEFALIRGGKAQKFGKVNLIGKLQLVTEKTKDEENVAIMELRALRTQEAIIKILKMRKSISNSQLQAELIEILKSQFIPTRKLIKEQLEWLIENKYIRRDESNINLFHYVA